jgi:hypothetical protein
MLSIEPFKSEFTKKNHTRILNMYEIFKYLNALKVSTTNVVSIASSCLTSIIQNYSLENMFLQHVQLIFILK